MIKLDDNITTPTIMRFNLEIIQNWPLKLINPIKEISAVANNQFLKNINVSNVF